MIDGPLPAMEASRLRPAKARHRGKGRKIFQDFVFLRQSADNSEVSGRA